MGEVDRPSMVELALRTMAAVLPAAGVALLQPDRSSVRVAVRLGFGPRLDKPLIANLSRALLEAAGASTAPPCSIIELDGLPAPFASGAAALIGHGTGQELGLLVALGRGPDPFDRHQRCTLARFADLIAAHVSHDSERRSVEMRMGELNRALSDALEALPEAIAVFDRDDRFVFWNRKFEETYAGPGVVLEHGTRFEDHLRACVAAGLVVAARGREEAWLAERLARFHAADDVHEHEIGDGHWVRVQDRPLPHGGRAGIRTDVTELIQRENSFRLLFEANPAPMLVLDRHTLQILAANDAAVALYGFDRQVLLQLTFADIQPGWSLEELESTLAKPGSAFAGTPQIHRAADGDQRMVTISTQPIERDGRPVLLAAMFDVTDRHRMEVEIRRTKAFLKDVVDQVPAAMFVKDMWDGGRYVICNRAGASLVGRREESVVGRRTEEVFGAEDAALIIEQDEKALRSGFDGIVEDQVRHLPDGTARSIRTRKVALNDSDQGKPRYVLGVLDDITDQRATEARIAHMAHHDALTDLPNRFLVHDRLKAALTRLPGSEERLAVFYIDLDGFKAVNDAFGHRCGDDLLVGVAGRLRETIRASDTAARIGGDEFVILQAPIQQIGEAAWLAGRLLSALIKPFEMDGRIVKIGVSIGICLAPQDGMEPSDLLARADTALYEAKREGRNRFRFADPTLNVHVEDVSTRMLSG